MGLAMLSPERQNAFIMKSPELKPAPSGIKPPILIVDDENGPRQALRMLLKEDYEVHVTDNVDAALAILERTPVDLVITDIRMPKKTGVDLLREAKAAHPDVQIIVLTGYGQLETAVKAVEYGAFSYMEKPFDNEVMLNLVSAAIQKHREEKHRRALEFIALEANRFATLGRVVSGMMHDLGSPLTVLGSQLELLSRETLAPELTSRFETMRRQVTHCTDLVRATMNFLRKQQGGDVPVSLNDVVQSCLKLAAPLFREFRVEIHQELDPNLRTISGDVVLLRQALLNLITNACQAMEQQSPARTISVRTWNDGPTVCLSVQDSGPGISPDAAPHIFDTFYTTKGDSGTGLGLGVVENVVKQHGGAIELDHNAGPGACFKIKFTER